MRRAPWLCFALLAASAARPARGGRPGDGLFEASVPAYVASDLVGATRRAAAARCASQLPAMRAHVDRYRSLEKVLVFEPPTWETQGIGTLVWWYIGAWKAGLGTRRAAFFSNGDGVRSRTFELNARFRVDALGDRGELLNWNWSERGVRGNVSAAMRARGLREPDAELRVVCEKAKACAFEAHAGPGDGSGARRLVKSARSLAAAAAVLASSAWVRVTMWDGDHGRVRPVKKWPNWLTQPLPGVSRPNGGVFDCGTHWLLRPAPSVQAAMLPIVQGVDRVGGALTGLHIRTLALDIIFKGRAARGRACPAEELRRQRALLGLSARLRGLQTAPNRSTAERALGEEWRLWNAMAAENCPKCATDPFEWCHPRGAGATSLRVAGEGALVGMVRCALAHGSRAPARRADGPTRVFVSTDSLGLVQLLRATPGLARLLVTTGDAPAHVQCDASRKRQHDACGSAAARDTAEIKAATDLSLLGLGGWAMQYSGSTFFTLAAAINPHLRGAAPGDMAGTCVRAPWSIPGCNRELVHWTDACAGAAAE